MVTIQRCQVVAQVDNFGVAHAPWFCRAGGGSWVWAKVMGEKQARLLVEAGKDGYSVIYTI